MIAADAVIGDQFGAGNRSFARAFLRADEDVDEFAL
jgi:hypothetical protein